MPRLYVIAAALLLSACYPWTPPALGPVTQPAPPATGQIAAPAYAASAAPTEARGPVTILVSIDGFRADYLDRGVTPELGRLAAGGVRSAVRPSFPSKTAPNHWTLVTGLRPDRNGIVSNNFVDPRRPKDTFTMAADDPFWWNEGEPVWVTAEKAGIRTAAMYWPGSNVAVGGVRADTWPNATTGGVRPSAWQGYYMALPQANRVDAVIDWLRRPATVRPRFLTLYFDTVDTAGHNYGPDAPETTAAVAEVDRLIGQLTRDLAELGQPANLIVTADHGMIGVSRDRLVELDTLIGKDSYRLLDHGAFATLIPNPGQEARIAAVLTKPQPHMQCWTRDAVPVRFHYGHNPRVAPIVCIAAHGWQIKRDASQLFRDIGGDHGFDPNDPQMFGLFVANGPAFQSGERLAPFDNVDVAPLVRQLIGLPADPTLDGNAKRFGPVLR